MDIELEGTARTLRSTTVHSLPCTIAYSGEAPVDRYFTPLIEDVDGMRLAAFRGHTLRGTLVPLPQGFKGIVYKEHRAVYSDQQARQWTPMSQFSALTYWNRTIAPSKGA